MPGEAMSGFCRICQRGGIGQTPSKLLQEMKTSKQFAIDHTDVLIEIARAALPVAWIAEVNPPNNGAERDLIAAFLKLAESEERK